MSRRYALLTAAKNEGRYIGTTIESVLKQSEHPDLWIIMDDGSTDETAAVIADYARRYPFIRLRANRAGAKRSFGAQYRAINAAYAIAREMSQFDFVAMQDADIELARPDYYQSLLSEFESDPTLGICGGFIYERVGTTWKPRPSNSQTSVAGGVQMFRIACFQAIGGYKPLAVGGEDWLAQLDAKATGWTVRPLASLPAYHHRPTSTAEGRLRGTFRSGMRDASFGSHPLFEVAKCMRRAGEWPLLLGSVVRYAGYVWYLWSGDGPVIPSVRVLELRAEQVARLMPSRKRRQLQA